MRLKTVYIRFYKSFNYDYLRKYHGGAKVEPWEKIDEMWYPYVRIPISSDVTTIVGANESGKSHLLTAIEKGITGKDIEREDFCRYSKFFSVEKGKLRWPDFGFEWDNLSADEQTQIKSMCEYEADHLDRFLFFRTNKDKVTLYIPNGEGYSQHDLSKPQTAKIERLLSHVFYIDAEVALPDTVPIRELAGKKSSSKAEIMGRAGRFGMMDSIYDSRPLFETQDNIAKNAAPIFSLISKFWGDGRESDTAKVSDRQKAEIELAHDLICKVANIDPEALWDLYKALREGKEGHANGIIQEINNRLEASLNFPHWWVQDKKFQLVVSPREFDLVFTIRDRTETEYSFNERSSGLKYFLSYYVQYRAHEQHPELPEILLMDEPDTYLSSQGQQDLLKIFEAFAHPDDSRRPVQVIYVTHSPFLIDKNHAERIRVLEKGISDEGTRVVKDAARNHYEPLRSAFGSFVGETTFIGNSNLMVEGTADQILLAGAATFLRSRSASKLEMLDLNNVTIVPVGSASSIPYMVYLARGRDVEQPAVTVLLDSDQAGNDAKRALKRGGARNRELLKEEFILQIGDLSENMRLEHLVTEAVEIEDLIPLAVCAAAANLYAREVCNINADLPDIKEDDIRGQLQSVDSRSFAAVKQAFANNFGEDYHIEKVGFARSVIDTLHVLSNDMQSEPVEKFEHNMKVLFRKINETMRQAERELSREKVSQKLDRLKESFLRDNPSEAHREDAQILFENIEASLEQNKESDEIKIAIAELRREFDIDNDFAQPIERFSEFRERLNAMKYAGRMATQDTSLE